LQIAEASQTSEARKQAFLRSLAILVTAGLLTSMIVVWNHAGRSIIGFHSPLPYWDYWSTVERIDQYRRFDFSVLWHQHNEHRIIFPELVFGIDYLLFRGREVLPVVISALCYIGLWAALSAAVYRTKLPLLARLCAIFLAGIIMGWQGGALLIASPFLLQWPLMLAASAAALLLLSRVPSARHPFVWLAVAILCGVVSTYSSGNGLFLWPILVTAAYILRLRKPQVAILIVSAAVFVGLYFIGFRFSHGSGVGALIEHPLFAVKFVAAYLAMPFTAVRPHLGVAVGLAGIAAYVGLAILACRRRVLATTPGVVLLGFYLLCLLTGVLIAAGRMNPQDPRYIAGTAQRYVVVPLAAWAALVLAAAWLLGNSRHLLWLPTLGLFALGWGATVRSPRLGFWVDNFKYMLSDCQVASLGFESGLEDPGLMRDVMPAPFYVARMLPVLRKFRLSTFASPRIDWLGKPADTVFSHISDQPEAGAVTTVYPIESGLIVLGWKEGARRIWHPQQFVFLNERGQIVGFGSKLPGGVPRGLATFDNPQSLAWGGFVNLHIPSESFSAYAVEAHGKALAPIGQMTAVPEVRPVPAAQPASPLLTIRWDSQGGWERNGVLPSTPSGMPSGDPYWESWADNDAETGQLTSSVFNRPTLSCLIVPAAHGASVVGLSLRVVDADTGHTATSVPMLGHDLVWRRWRLPLPPGPQHLQIVADDNGRNWGAWLVVGQPQQCE
jgi:hypothetical protein